VKVTVFGSTGRTGQLVVRQALAAGHDVTAVARRPEAVDADGPRLRLVRADLLDRASLDEALFGADAVLSAAGSGGVRKRTTVYSEGTASVLAAMGAAGVRRLVVVSATPVAPDGEKTLLERCLLHPVIRAFFGPTYEDMARMEQLLRASTCEWTVLRPPRLTSGPTTHRYRTAVDAPLRGARSVSRGDLAAAMLAAVEDRSLIRHAVTIAR
jgi:putative NADH-flavin reductase